MDKEREVSAEQKDDKSVVMNFDTLNSDTQKEKEVQKTKTPRTPKNEPAPRNKEKSKQLNELGVHG